MKPDPVFVLLCFFSEKYGGDMVSEEKNYVIAGRVMIMMPCVPEWQPVRYPLPPLPPQTTK